MNWPFLTRRAAALSEGAARALAYAEGCEAGRAEALRELLEMSLKVSEMEDKLADLPDCDKCDRIAPDDIAEAVAEARMP